jgi:hypothetical protein
MPLGLFKKWNVKNTAPSNGSDVIVSGDESIMSKTAHGTSTNPVQNNLKWNADRALSDRICNFNLHGAERSG